MLKAIFILIAILSILLLYFGTRKNKKMILLVVLWQIFIGILAWNHVFIGNLKIFPLVILGTIVLTIFGLKQCNVTEVTNYLLAIHSVRIPVELVLYQLYLQEKIPKLMTFSGWNFDIAIGISALILLVYQLILNRKINRTVFLIWNIFGMVFLLIIVSLAILSSPLPIQQIAFNQPNIAVLEFPYCFLPTCVVPIVLMSHILLLKIYNSMM